MNMELRYMQVVAMARHFFGKASKSSGKIIARESLP
jgi:hypothetical protein